MNIYDKGFYEKNKCRFIIILDKRGVLTELISDEEIKWSDSFALDGNGNILFTTSQIHLPKERRNTYKIFRLKLND